MNYKIVADSSSNVFELSGVDYAHVPLKILNQGVEYVDVPGLDVFGMLDAMKASREGSSTSCPNVYEWKEAFGDAEAVFAVTITSNLSGSYAAARTAAEDYMEEHPGRRVSVIDTLSVGPEAHLVIEKLAQLMAEGLSFDEIDAKVREYLKTTRLCFSLESIENLARNGRCSMAVAKLVGVMGIRIVGRASDEGTLQQLHKCRGEKKALVAVFDEMKSRGYCGGKVWIDHCLNLNAAMALKEAIRAEFPESVVHIGTCMGLCSYYAEHGGLLIGYEGA
jgi:DegV family protein with EDD domain